MIKKFYSDYVRHAMRFYARHLENPEFRCEADRKNWNACAAVLDKHFHVTKKCLYRSISPMTRLEIVSTKPLKSITSPKTTFGR